MKINNDDNTEINPVKNNSILIPMNILKYDEKYIITVTPGNDKGYLIEEEARTTNCTTCPSIGKSFL